MPIFSRAFLLLLIISLGMGQKANTSPQSDKNLVHVGYVGESLQNIPDAYGKMIRQKMLALLNQNYYEFHHPNELYQSHPSQIDAVKQHHPTSIKNALEALASSANLNYIFTIQLENIAEPSGRVMLRGEIMRFNRQSNDIYRHEVLSYVEDLDLHLKTVKEELVTTIPHSVYGIGRSRAYLLLGIGLVLFFALSQTFGGSNNILGDGEGPRDPEPPIGN